MFDIFEAQDTEAEFRPGDYHRYVDVVQYESPQEQQKFNTNRLKHAEISEWLTQRVRYHISQILDVPADYQGGLTRHSARIWLGSGCETQSINMQSSTYSTRTAYLPILSGRLRQYFVNIPTTDIVSQLCISRGPNGY